MAEQHRFAGEHSVAAVALLSGAAGVIHASVIVEHFTESTLFGVFFAVAAAFQLLWAAAILTWPRRYLLGLGAIGNAVIVLIWLASRTVGLPVGPEPWTTEAPTLPDLMATTFECGVVLLGGWLRSKPLPVEDVLIRRLDARFRVFAVVLLVVTLAAIVRGH
jgi:hypothetical protein